MFECKCLRDCDLPVTHRGLIEAAEDLGDGKLRRFLRVTLPLSMPGVIAATIIVFIPTIGDYVTPRLVGGPNGLMISNMIELQFKKANDAPLGSALAISAMAIVTFVSLIFIMNWPSHFLITFQNVAHFVMLMMCPLNGIDIDSFFEHFPQRTHLS